MMRVSIVQLESDIGSSYPFIFTTSADEIDLVHETYSIEGKIEVKGSIVNTGKVYRVEGVIYCKKTFRCDRCLEHFVHDQKHSFDESYKKEAEDQNENVNYFNGEALDLTDLVRDVILLSQPLNNICSPDCRGLCMKCGANLNETECGCDRHIVDPRLAALQEALNKE